MPAPTILSTSPGDLGINVYRNKIVSVVFDQAMLASTISTATVFLRSADTGETATGAVSLSTDLTTASLTLTRAMAPDSTYILTVVGFDASSSCCKSSGSVALAATKRVTFQTGQEYDAPTLTKSSDDLAAQGDLSLPSNVTVNATSTYLSILSTTPQNRQAEVDVDFSPISVVFDGTIDTSTVSSATFTVAITAYYPEDEDYLAFPTGDGQCNFQFQKDIDTSTNNPFDYSDPSGTLYVQSNTITWTPNKPVPNNSKVSLTINQAIKNTGGYGLDGHYRLQFFTKVCPFAASVEAVRDQFYPYVLSAWTDDMITKTLYKNTMEAMDRIRFGYDNTRLHPAFREYVLYRSVDDIFQAMQIENELKAGQFKKLGDLMVRYDFRMAQSIPQAQRDAIARWNKAFKVLTRIYVGTMRLFVKGVNDPEQRMYWRNRHWRSDLMSHLQAYYMTKGGFNMDRLAGNTNSERGMKTPGFFDAWS